MAPVRALGSSVVSMGPVKDDSAITGVLVFTGDEWLLVSADCPPLETTLPHCQFRNDKLAETFGTGLDVVLRGCTKYDARRVIPGYSLHPHLQHTTPGTIG